MDKYKFKKQVVQRAGLITTLSKTINSENFSFEKVIELFQHIGWIYINIFKIMKIQPAGLKIFGIENNRRKKAKKEKQSFIDCINEIANRQSWDTSKSRKNLTITGDSIMFGRKHGHYKKMSITSIKKLEESLQDGYKDIIIDFIQHYCQKLETTWILP